MGMNRIQTLSSIFIHEPVVLEIIKSKGKRPILFAKLDVPIFDQRKRILSQLGGHVSRWWQSRLVNADGERNKEWELVG